VRLGAQDVYVSAVGGMRLTEPATDLGVAVAVAAAVTDLVVPDDLVVIGEVGLGGEVRQVVRAARRLAEAARLGYRRAIVPASSPPVDGIELICVATLAEALGRACGPEGGWGASDCNS
jgi:DNA repair protein RadA/Sms